MHTNFVWNKAAHRTAPGVRRTAAPRPACARGWSSSKCPAPCLRVTNKRFCIKEKGIRHGLCTRDITRQKKPCTSSTPQQQDSIWRHGITCIFLLAIVASGAWAGMTYALPLVQKLADKADILVAKSLEKFAIVDLVEKQARDMEKLLPQIQDLVESMTVMMEDMNQTLHAIKASTSLPSL
jgi:hypothetical protein